MVYVFSVEELAGRWASKGKGGRRGGDFWLQVTYFLT